MPFMQSPTAQVIALAIFALALLHTFATGPIHRLASRLPRHSGLLHLLGEVEVVFGLWAVVLLLCLALAGGGAFTLAYAESRSFTEPLFVFAVMLVAASRPISGTVLRAMGCAATRLPLRAELAQAWLGLAVVPLLGSLITEPAAMTIAALLLRRSVFMPHMPEPVKYFALAVLLVNVSIGGTLTAYAAPPVLMVASVWQWDSAFMLTAFGWKAAIAVAVNATAATWLLRRHLPAFTDASAAPMDAVLPPIVVLVHGLLLAGIVGFAHHPVIFLALLLVFLALAQAYPAHHTPLIVREAMLVAVFLAGLVVLGGMQSWWLQPMIEGLRPIALFFGALALTAITDNAALTYLGAQLAGLSAEARYLLVAGAVAGGGLTVIANAPNPAGIALLRGGFAGSTVGAGRLLLAALAPTAVAAAAFLLL